MTSILATKDLCKFFVSGENLIKAVDYVNLQIGQGEYVAIAGKSGSGRSTLLHLLGGLENPTSGEIWVGGKNIANLSEEKLASLCRRRIGFVFQAFNLIPSLNVWENIVLPIGLDGKRADDAFVRDILRTLNMEAKTNALPNTLSGGQQQRTAIARAIAAKPSIILADEPTGNLDTKNSDEVISLLKLSARKYGQTLVVITHDEDIAQMTDRTIMLTTTLLMGLITSAIGSFDMTRQQAIAEGNHHAVITHLTEKQIEMLNNHLDVESLEAALQFATISYDNMDGYLTAGTTFKEGIYYVSVITDVQEIGKLKALQGQVPERATGMSGCFNSVWQIFSETKNAL